MRDVLYLAREIVSLVKQYFKDYWDEELEEHYLIVERELRKVTPR